MNMETLIHERHHFHLMHLRILLSQEYNQHDQPISLQLSRHSSSHSMMIGQASIPELLASLYRNTVHEQSSIPDIPIQEVNLLLP
jgi:hypothetical protein